MTHKFENGQLMQLETLPAFNGFLTSGGLPDKSVPPFQGRQPDHMGVESSSCCLARELVIFVRPGEVVSVDLWHVTGSPPIGKRN